MNLSLATILVLIWCAAIVWSDWQSRRIPNSLVLAGLTVAVLGLVFQGHTLFGASPLLSFAGAVAGLSWVSRTDDFGPGTGYHWRDVG